MPPETSLWHEYGLPGAVISALMCGFYYLFNELRKDAKEQLTRHYEERESWRKDIGDQNTSVNKVVSELAIAVRDQVDTNKYHARIHQRNSRSLQNIARELKIEHAIENDSDDDLRPENNG